MISNNADYEEEYILWKKTQLEGADHGPDRKPFPDKKAQSCEKDNKNKNDMI